MPLFGRNDRCHTLRVETYRFEAGPPPLWRLAVIHVFSGRTRADAEREERAHRRLDTFYAAAVGPGRLVDGTRLRTRQRWVCA